MHQDKILKKRHALILIFLWFSTSLHLHFVAYTFLRQMEPIMMSLEMI